MRQREVPAHGIVGVQHAQARRDLLGGGPVGVRSRGEAEQPRDPADVRVQRDHEVPRVQVRPDSQVHVIAPHHPAHQHEPALAGASLAGVGEPGAEAARRSRRRERAQRVDGGPERFRRGTSGGKQRPQPAVACPHVAQERQQCAEVLRRVPAVAHAGQGRETPRVRGVHERGGSAVRIRDREDPRDDRAEQVHPTVGVQRREGRGDLDVRGILVGARKSHRVPRDAFRRRAGGVHAREDSREFAVRGVPTGALRGRAPAPGRIAHRRVRTCGEAGARRSARRARSTRRPGVREHAHSLPRRASGGLATAPRW